MGEGGGYCVDEDSCSSTDRGSAITSSTSWPQQLRKEGLFARGPGATPQLASAAHAFIAYCSSDSWLGNSSVRWSDGRPWHFQGARILAESFSILLRKGMSRAGLVLISLQRRRPR